MDSSESSATETTSGPAAAGESKQITIEVPADRLPEFYAFFGRFLAGGGPGRGRRRHHGHRHGHGHRGHGCGGPRTDAQTTHEAESAGGPPPGTISL